MTEQVRLDWSTAEVTDDELAVTLSARPNKQWREAFERTASLLSAGTWTATVSARKSLVQVGPVRPGEESRVRQLIEGALLEANATLVSEDELFDRRAADEEPMPSSELNAGQPLVDEELTQRFRAFAEEKDAGK